MQSYLRNIKITTWKPRTQSILIDLAKLIFEVEFANGAAQLYPVLSFNWQTTAPLKPFSQPIKKNTHDVLKRKIVFFARFFMTN